MGLSTRRQYPLPRRVCPSADACPYPNPTARFAQYIYGVYLGLSGKPILSVRLAPRTHCPSLALFDTRGDPSCAAVTAVRELCRVPARVQYRQPCTESVLWLVDSVQFGHVAM